MGVAIIGYSGIKLVKATKEYDEEWESSIGTDLVRVYENPGFPGRIGELVEGYYSYEAKTYGFRAPYSAYGNWRGRLCKQFLGVEDKLFWANTNLPDFVNKPFTELINFSDCEGCIGYPVTTKLYRDFCVNLPAIQEENPVSPYDSFKADYKSLMKAFELAQTGVILFT